MPLPPNISASTENNFIAGLKTEFTGLNFPENAATDSQNVIYDIVGDVTRRGGIDFEANHTNNVIDRDSKALSTYVWANAGGDGTSKLLVSQVGGTLYFYNISAATTSAPLSAQRLSSTIDGSSFVSDGGTFDPTIEFQYSDGNGYLFVFHPNCDPFYCTYSSGTIMGSTISIRIRDLDGIVEGVDDNNRPATLSAEHQYNLYNQGWSNTSNSWSASSSSTGTTGTGSKTWNVGTLAIPNGPPVGGDKVSISAYQFVPGTGWVFVGSMSGTVTSYADPNVTINVTSSTTSGISYAFSSLSSNSTGKITTFHTALGAYPSNSDVWWLFKNSSGVFDPATTAANVSLNAGAAPKGGELLEAFNQDRTAATGIDGLTVVSTIKRPRTGAWFQGRVWYAGIDSSQAPSGDAQFYSWSENIYFSQIITNVSQFGKCYQNNDPTSEDFFDLLPTDGGVIAIQGSGAIYKLFPIQNGVLVFAANGIWFITGSQGIGFRANDYTITKISGVQSISGTSFVNVLGWPVFWNAEGIYSVQPGQGGFAVDNLCLKSILRFYADIPLVSKQYSRGDYDPLNFVISWVFRSTPETTTSDRYQFDRILNFNTATRAFYYHTLATNNISTYLHDIRFVQPPSGGTNIEEPIFKYLTSFNDGSSKFTFSEENDFTRYVDWFSANGVGVNFTSYFITGYKMRPIRHPYLGMYGQAPKRYQNQYIYIYCRNETNTAYKIQSIWEFGTSGNSGRWSNLEKVVPNTTLTVDGQNFPTNADPNTFGMFYKRHKLRGRGISLQIRIVSVDGSPFDIMGWSLYEQSRTQP